jgi:hypothetical protein
VNLLGRLKKADGRQVDNLSPISKSTAGRSCMSKMPCTPLERLVADRRPRRCKKPRPRERPGLIGRSRVIRTLDPLLPKQVRYQAALYSVRTRHGTCWLRHIGAVAASRDGPGYSRACSPVQASRKGFLQAPPSSCAAHSKRVGTAPVGVSPSGKASVFGTDIPRFESWHPSQFPAKSLILL